MEQLEGTVTMPLITYQKMRNDTSQIFDSHGTNHNSKDEKGTCVNDCDAYQYALEQMQWDEELQKEFVEWFYSGNYVHEEEENA